MKAMPTQFDSRGFSGAVATPTCSSCCCCCCCLATTIAGSAVVGQETYYEGMKNGLSKPRSRSLAIGAGSLVPLAIVAFIGFAVALANTDVVHDEVGIFVLAAAAAFAGFGALLYATLRTAKSDKAGPKATIFAVLLPIVLAGEVVGAISIMFSSEFGTLGYLGLVAVVCVAVIVGNAQRLNTLYTCRR